MVFVEIASVTKHDYERLFCLLNFRATCFALLKDSLKWAPADYKILMNELFFCAMKMEKVNVLFSAK
ncbi:hypothetical protein AVEN_191964-1 [Araneus ventricosus]|uniref:Uncharacterized protein n=1 Tax=Araneus ventricosus TaxID=182803 RepID=A0A4Y2L782_ARAVE|nr:hypothetical protein AVEN_191964-1 [Araneus ventricosus]